MRSSHACLVRTPRRWRAHESCCTVQRSRRGGGTTGPQELESHTRCPATKLRETYIFLSVGPRARRVGWSRPAAGWSMASTGGIARTASMVRVPAHASTHTHANSHTRTRQSKRASTYAETSSFFFLFTAGTHCAPHPSLLLHCTPLTTPHTYRSQMEVTKLSESLLDGQEAAGAPLSGMLISWLSLFDFDERKKLTEERWKWCADALMFETSSTEWELLRQRHGDANSQGATCRASPYPDPDPYPNRHPHPGPHPHPHPTQAPTGWLRPQSPSSSPPRCCCSTATG